MDERGLFQVALGLDEPWEVVRLDFDAEKARLDIHLDFPPGSHFLCPEGGESCPVHDTETHEWRHLNFFQHLTYLHARRPRVKCPQHGVLTVHVPWARPFAGFTLLLEALIMTFARNGMTPTAIGRIIGEHDTRVWRVLEHYVTETRQKLSLASVREVGVDETSRAKGYEYVTVFADMREGRVVFATEGKDHTTVERFKQDLLAHQGDPMNIREISLDMSQAFEKGVRAELPNAELTFDKFHVISLVNNAVDDVRREEQKLRPELKNTRYIWLKNPENHTETQKDRYEALKDSTLKTARACRIKTTLQEIYRGDPDDAFYSLSRWYGWAIRSRLKPMGKVARTIAGHWEGVLRWFESGLTNGLLEGINSLIQAAKARARGFRSARNLITTIYLLLGKLDFDLPTVCPLATHTE